MSVLEILPLVVVMVAGPQLLSAIFLATSRNWRRNSAAFVAGAALSISLVVSLAYALGIGARMQGGSRPLVSAIVLVALLFAMVHTYTTRADAEPPKWMRTMETATTRFSFKIGFFLLGFFPTDIFTSVAVGSYLVATDAPLIYAAPFVFLTLGVLSLPALLLVAFGDRAEAALPRVRSWMNDNAWLVNEFVLLLFVGMSLNNLLG